MYLELYGSAICKRFLFPESNDPPKITTPPLKLRPPKAVNSESNEGRYYRNSTVTLLSGRDVMLSLWYSDSQLKNGSPVNSDNFY